MINDYIYFHFPFLARRLLISSLSQDGFDDGSGRACGYLRGGGGLSNGCVSFSFSNSNSRPNSLGCLYLSRYKLKGTCFGNHSWGASVGVGKSYSKRGSFISVENLDQVKTLDIVERLIKSCKAHLITKKLTQDIVEEASYRAIPVRLEKCKPTRSHHVL